MVDISWRTRRKGFWLFKQNKIKKELETGKRIHFTIFSENEEYSVIYDKIKGVFSCDCSFYSLKFTDCSHIIGVKLFLEGEESAG